jgi:hypothetical protein
LVVLTIPAGYKSQARVRRAVVRTDDKAMPIVRIPVTVSRAPRGAVATSKSGRTSSRPEVLEKKKETAGADKADKGPPAAPDKDLRPAKQPEKAPAANDAISASKKKEVAGPAKPSSTE